MRHWLRRLSMAVGALSALGLSAPAMAESGTDERLVVAGGCATEIVYALGAGDRVVAVDSTSAWPPEARDLPRIGYVRALPVEGILSMEPDRLLAVAEAGPSTAIDKLRAAMPVDVLPPLRDPRALPDQVRRVAAHLDLEERGKTLADALEARLAEIPAGVDTDAAPSVLILLAAGGNQLLAGGANSSAHALLDALGLRNAAAGLESFKPMSRESLLQIDADLIVIAETAPGAFDPAAWPALAHTPAGKADRVLVRDAMYLLGFGPRVIDAMQELRAAVVDPNFTAWKRS
ncbi:MAG: ABC transporter substrate-binding protein [Algiphilus sp.]|uniref:heme/hemin ABC transporter substrate-binding protein n=1 Tax=Algiphilus sp. TaxID=1872431 RepID=UPI002A648BD7|nr:ABC transporter substrate-binding protein [Pseudomonadota bacterium]